MQSLVKSDSVCIDIGGHYGYFTHVMACLARDGKVDTFEPVPALANRIGESAKRSRLDKVTVHSAAVADCSGEMTLRFTSGLDHDSMAYLENCGGIDTEASREHYSKFQSVTVPVVSLDQLQDCQPDFIKIDAEGAEAAVLRGGLKKLATRNVRLFIEVHGIQEGLDCAEILREIGYRAIPLSTQKTTMPILWLADGDHEAVEAVAEALGSQPRMMFQS